MPTFPRSFRQGKFISSDFPGLEIYFGTFFHINNLPINDSSLISQKMKIIQINDNSIYRTPSFFAKQFQINLYQQQS